MASLWTSGQWICPVRAWHFALPINALPKGHSLLFYPNLPSSSAAFFPPKLLVQVPKSPWSLLKPEAEHLPHMIYFQMHGHDYFSLCPYMCVCLITQLCLTLCDPLDCSPPGSSVHGIFQIRLLEWVAISFSGGSSEPRDWPCISCMKGGLFTHWAIGEASCGHWPFVYHLWRNICQVFGPFIWVVCFVVLSLRTSLYIQDVNLLSGLWFADFPIPWVAFLFCWYCLLIHI